MATTIQNSETHSAATEQTHDMSDGNAVPPATDIPAGAVPVPPGTWDNYRGDASAVQQQVGQQQQAGCQQQVGQQQQVGSQQQQFGCQQQVGQQQQFGSQQQAGQQQSGQQLPSTAPCLGTNLASQTAQSGIPSSFHNHSGVGITYVDVGWRPPYHVDGSHGQTSPSENYQNHHES